ncbi:MAG: hypothetical protein H0U74_18385 [Bradymonadaceae bacterium]|nr:hypothetical protein [Lujinxingiaceae bacterium]
MKSRAQFFFVILICLTFFTACSETPDSGADVDLPDASSPDDTDQQLPDTSTINDTADENDSAQTACGAPCTGDLQCDSGRCACTPGLTRCGDTCAQTDGVCAVDIANIAFSPRELTIEVGTSVEWTNLDGATHTVTSGTAANSPGELFDSGSLARDAQFQRTFDESGEFPYFCRPHAGSMTAKVIVLEP